MTTLRPYPAYKPSGVEWLGDIPAHWPDAKLGRLASAQSGGTPSMAKRDYWLPEVPWVSSKDMKRPRISNSKMWVSRSSISDGRTGLAGPGSILMVVRSGILRHTIPVAIVDREVAFNQDIKAFALLTNALLPEYFAGLVRGNQSSLLTMWSKQGATVESLEHSWIMDTRVPLPPLDEQRAIADFLDVMDARITRFVSTRKRMIALLEEQKAAIITQAVTRGLDPDVPLKPSGVDWLGDIPAHWEIRPLRSVIVNTVVGLWGDEPTEQNEPDHIRCIRVADFAIPSLSINDTKATSRAVPQHARGQRLLVDGDILLEKSGGGENQPVGRVVIFTGNEPAITSNFVSRLRVNRARAVSRFILLLMDSMQRGRITTYSIKQTTGIQNLDERGYLSNRVGIPPIEEQYEIVDQCDTESRRVDRMVEKARREINLIYEYRTRLISDVVTGKLDVRGVELPVLEEVVDAEVETELADALEDEEVIA